MTEPRNIVVVGGGFAGTTLARRLERMLPRDHQVVLVSEESFTTFNPMLAEVVGAAVFPEHVVAPIRQMLRPASRFIMGRVTGVDFGSRTLVANTLAGRTEIAFEHLIQKQVRNHGLTPEQIEFQRPAVSEIIRGYTREAGVRNLEREIGALCRKVARRRAEGDETKVVITPELVVEMLGAPTFLDEEIENRTKDPGVAVGLAWTPAGGEVLFVEASRMQGGGTLTLTGHLGDVMKESARTALSWFRANAAHYGVDPAFYKDSEIHLHVPSGAVPKDGPSAGVTMVSALASELTGRPVRGDIAMTGEISLSGRVLPVGGVKEKVLAARRHGITELVLPRQNEKNVTEDLTEDLRRELTIHYVTEISDVLAIALTPSPSQTTTPMPLAGELQM